MRQLAHAGERALRLDAAAAERHFARALELAGTDTSERLRLLPRWAQALFLRNRNREAVGALEEAITGLQACGDIRAAAVAMTCLATVRETLGEPYGDLKRAAVELLANDGPSAEQADVCVGYAAHLLLDEGDYQSALAAATRAIEISEQLALPEPAMAISRLGTARFELGDLGGLEDHERALAAARAQGLGVERAVIEWNYVCLVFMTTGARAALDLRNEGLEFARRHGIEVYELAYRAGLVCDLCNVGDWNRALAEAGDLVATLEAAEDILDLLIVRAQRALILACRGEPLEAAPLVAWLAEKGRQSEHRQFGAWALLAASAVRLRLGEPEAALALLHEWVPRMDAMGSDAEEYFPEALRLALACDDAQLAAQIVETLESFAAMESLPLHRYVLATVGGLLAESRGEHEAALTSLASAAAGWCEFGMPYEEAQALLGQGRCLVALGRAQEATVPLAAAREIFTRLGAKPALAEADELIQQVASA
jgi:tetratricopeptide (TPR) repeat protein